MLSTSDILFGVALPLILAGVILALARRHRWAGPLAIGAAFTAAFGLLEGATHLFPPASATPWLFYLGVLFTAAGVIDAVLRLPNWLRPIMIFLAALLGAGLLLRFNFKNRTWDALEGSLWLIGIASIAVIWWICFEYVASEGGIVMPVGAMLTSGIAGLVVMLVADQTVGQAMGAMAVALISAAAVVAWFKDVSLTRGTAVVIAGLGVSGLAAAYFVSGVPPLDLSLVAVAPLLLAGSRWLPIKRPSLRVMIRLLIVLIPLGVALGLAAAQFHREQAENSSNPYSE